MAWLAFAWLARAALVAVRRSGAAPAVPAPQGGGELVAEPAFGVADARASSAPLRRRLPERSGRSQTEARPWPATPTPAAGKPCRRRPPGRAAGRSPNSTLRVRRGGRTHHARAAESSSPAPTPKASSSSSATPGGRRAGSARSRRCCSNRENALRQRQWIARPSARGVRRPGRAHRRLPGVRREPAGRTGSGARLRRRSNGRASRSASGSPPAPGCTSPPRILSGCSRSTPAAARPGCWRAAPSRARGSSCSGAKPSGGPGGTPVWRQQSLGPSGSLGSLFAQAESLSGVRVAAPHQAASRSRSPSQGVWVDVAADRRRRRRSTRPSTTTSPRARSPAPGATSPRPPASAASRSAPICPPRGLAASPGRGGGPSGERTITGVGQGAMLSLEGSAFTRIALAGGQRRRRSGRRAQRPRRRLARGRGCRCTSPATPSRRSCSPGRSPSAARSPRSRPSPARPVGALGSEALAVGDDGQVARYVPGRRLGTGIPAVGVGQAGDADPARGRLARSRSRLRGRRRRGDVALAAGDRALGTGSRRAAQPGAGELHRDRLRSRPIRPAATRSASRGCCSATGASGRRNRCRRACPPEANFTSIAFAGDEALATYKFPVNRNGAARLHRRGAGQRRLRLARSTTALRRRSAARSRNASPAFPTAAR